MATNKLWRMVYPLQARANNAKTEESLQMLQSVRVRQFVPDDPRADLETFGLQPPELEVALGQGTNTIARLQFGKSPTNDTRLVYARRVGLNAIVAVPKDLLAPWYASVNDFRDPVAGHLDRSRSGPSKCAARTVSPCSSKRMARGASCRRASPRMPAWSKICSPL